MSNHFSRRQLLTSAAVAGGACLLPSATTRAADNRPTGEPFGYCLNTSTIRGQNLSIVEEVEIIAKAGFTAVEPWMNELEKHVRSGKTLSDLNKRIADLGLTVESAIGFAEWIVDDDERRKKGLETAKRDIEMLKAIGGKRIAAPPAGATNQTDLDLRKVAVRYRELCDLGEKFEIVPQIEVWGFSKSLSRLGEVAYIAIESGHKNACVLADVYHVYKGGSDIAALRLFSGASMHVLHINDYPSTPPRETIGDKDRVYPGDGVAPMKDILRTLRDIGYRGVLSVELFNPEYYKLDAAKVARTAFEKTREAVLKSLS